MSAPGWNCHASRLLLSPPHCASGQLGDLSAGLQALVPTVHSLPRKNVGGECSRNHGNLLGQTVCS